MARLAVLALPLLAGAAARQAPAGGASAPPGAGAPSVDTIAADTFAVGPVRAPRGASATGWLPIAPRGDSGTRIPVRVIHGARPGPVVALVAGTQGGKVAPIVALHELAPRLDARALRGTVILVHVANLPAFAARSAYRGPWDGKNGNRVYPGRADGTVSERLAHAITTHVVAPADYVVDLHAAEPTERSVAFAFAARPGLDARTDSLAWLMARAWGAERVVRDADGPRTLADATYLQTTAHLLGKPALTVMAGDAGRADASAVAWHRDGAVRLLQWLGLLDGGPPAARPVVVYGAMDAAVAPEGGVWTPAVAPGARVDSGAVLGTLRDHFGERPRAVRSTAAGDVLYLLDTPAVSAGEPVALLGVR